MIDFSQKLKQLLLSKYSKLKDAAVELDVNYTQLSQYCSGIKNPSIEFLQKIVTTFPDADLNWLLRDTIEVAHVLNEDPEHYNTASNNEIVTKIEVLLQALKSQLPQK